MQKKKKTSAVKAKKTFTSQKVTKVIPVEKETSSSGARYLFSGLLILLLVGYVMHKRAVNHANTTSSSAISPTQAAPVMTNTPQTGSTHGSSPSAAVDTTSQESAIVTDDTLPTGPAIKTLPFTAGKPFTYTVRKNDSLAKIGTIFCNDTKAYFYLADDNNISEPYTLQVNQQIRVACQ